MTTPKPGPAADNEAEKLWRFVSPAQFEQNRPQEPTQEAVRHGLRTLWNRLPFNRPSQSESEIPEEARSLKSASLRWMDMAAPPPQWDRVGGPGLDEGLHDWLEQGADAGAKAILVGPGAGVAEMVRAWGQDQAIPILTPPSPEAILSGEDWLAQVRKSGLAGDGRVILPGLERCYLRHPNGLDLVRGLLDLFLHKEIACLLTCDSWAWAYLNRTLHVESIVPAPLTLAPFDADALAAWFQELSGRHDRRAFTFRQVTNGRPVLSSASDHEADQGESDEKAKTDREFLVHLAARSRGNPGVARAIWRESLQVNSLEEVDTKAQEEAAKDRGYTMWVNPWSKLTLPSLPNGANRKEGFVLHALLLHNGLPAALLPHLLPLGPGEVVQILQRLRGARLVEGSEDRWYVSPLGYPAVRAFLAQRGFLTDVL